MYTFFLNREIDKGELKRLIAWYLVNEGRTKTLRMIDQLKVLGFHHATKAGLSLGIEDLKIPPAKRLLLAYAENEVVEADDRLLRGQITAVEKSQKVLDVWNAASELLKDEVVEYFRQTDLLNPVYMMAFSGARGNLSQVRQLVGMRGLMSDPQGEIIDLPIKSNFREGLTVTEYIISCYGARKGLVDTALKTANSGYLTRRLVDVAQALIIKEGSCQTFRGIFLSDLKDEGKVLLPLKKRLVGRVLASSIRHNQQILAYRNEDICPDLANKLVKLKRPKVFVRSPLTCQTLQHVCQLCYGWSLAQGSIVDLGESIGIIAAQSIGEPGTQLTMRTFHTGGVFSGGVAERIYAPHHGLASFQLPTDAKSTRTIFGQEGFFSKEVIKLVVRHPESTTEIEIPPYTILLIKPNTQVFWKQVIAEISDVKRINSKISTQQGVQAFKEVGAKNSGEVYYHTLNLITKREKLKKQLTKSEKEKFTKSYESRQLKKKEEQLYEKKEKSRIVGNSCITVLDGKVQPISTLKLKLAAEGDFLVNPKSPQLQATEFQNSYSKPSLGAANDGFHVTTPNYSLVSRSNNEWFPQGFFPFSSLFFKGHQTNRIENAFYISTNTRLKAIKTSMRKGIFLKEKDFIQQTEKTYCFRFPIENNSFTSWFYLPVYKQLPRTKAGIRGLFQHNFSLVKAFTSSIDGIEFSDSVFSEWTFSKFIKMGVWFQKPTCIETLEKNSAQRIQSSPVYIAKEKTPFTDKVSKISQPSKKVISYDPIPELITMKDETRYCVFDRRLHQIKFFIKGRKPKVKISEFVLKGDQLAEGIITHESGVVEQVTKYYITLRIGILYRASAKSRFSVMDQSLIEKGSTLFRLVYQKAKTEDIVQGLPKIEELLEARRTKGLRPIKNNSHERLEALFKFYKKDWGPELAVTMSLGQIQKQLVDGVQKVYQSQGVDISDKHIEIIIKQMTSRVFIVHGGQTPLVYGDLIELYQLNKINQDASAAAQEPAKYEPTILGITKASLTPESFLSAASFQETTRVLAQAAVEGKIDRFKGLKENVLIGRLIPAGTGFLSISSGGDRMPLWLSNDSALMTSPGDSALPSFQ